MKTYKEMCDNVIRRSKVIIENKKKKRMNLLTSGVAIVGVCILLSIILFNNRDDKVDSNKSIDASDSSKLCEENSSDPSKVVLMPAESMIVWLDKNNNYDYAEDKAEDDGNGYENETSGNFQTEIWYEKSVKNSLLKVLDEELKDKYLAIEIFCKDKDILVKIQNYLNETNVYSESKSTKGTLVMFITKDQFQKLNFIGMSDCIFDLARKGEW